MKKPIKSVPTEDDGESLGRLSLPFRRSLRVAVRDRLAMSNWKVEFGRDLGVTSCVRRAKPMQGTCFHGPAHRVRVDPHAVSLQP